MTTIAATIKITSILITRRTPTQSWRQQHQKQQSHKNGNSSDGNENRNNNNRYQNRLRKSNLITICTNPVVRIKQNTISDKVFNVQSPWQHCLQNTFPIVFSL